MGEGGDTVIATLPATKKRSIKKMEAMGADDCWDFTNDLVDSDNDDNDDVS